MCQAFSAIVLRSGEVLWKLGVDSHMDIFKLNKEKYNLADDTADTSKIRFCKIEIVPKNGNYLQPDKWILKIDQEIPDWWKESHDRAAWRGWKKWKAELDKILIYKPIVNPFSITPPEKITKKHTDLLKKWRLVRNSVKCAVENSVWDSVGYVVGDSVRDVEDSVWDSVRYAVEDSVWDSAWGAMRDLVRNSIKDSINSAIWAYIGSFFNLPRGEWKHTEKIQTEGYPFQSAVDLWNLGLVPSFDGTTWRLHGGKKAEILWEGIIKEK